MTDGQMTDGILVVQGNDAQVPEGAWAVVQQGRIVDVDPVLLRWHLKPVRELIAWLTFLNLSYQEQ